MSEKDNLEASNSESLVYRPSNVSWAVSDVMKRKNPFLNRPFLYFISIWIIAFFIYIFLAEVPRFTEAHGVLGLRNESFVGGIGFSADLPHQIDMQSKVDIYFDGFPNGEYKSIQGKIINVNFVSKDEKNNKINYRGLISLDEEKIVARSGEVEKLTSGMTFKTQIHIGEESVFESWMKCLLQTHQSSQKERKVD
ncbi:MAG: hypothetical protein H6621_08775 [Halobacteriovoraceae bacterium]|nr:hypothetical protein [Halobacteriovoraceae bacterium]MCB9095147.1 hypothetical protein [Halobacteriovoraceae bacterium]